MDSFQRSNFFYVKVGMTMHEARNESTVTEKQDHVVVQWDINNRSEKVDPKDVTSMFRQRKRIKQNPTISLSEIEAHKSTKTSSTKKKCTNNSKPIYLLKGMSKKGKKHGTV